MTGTTLAQAIPILLSPALTRLYSPESFGALGAYIAASAILIVIATGKYENALLIQKKTGMPTAWQ